MENLIWSAMMAMAMLIGGLLAWFLLRIRLVQAQAAAIALKETEIAVLEERLKARDLQFLDMQGAMSRLDLEKDQEITWYAVEAENYESIHNHNAYAYIEKHKT